MLSYTLRRLLLLPLTLLGITLVTFLVIRLAPGDPAAMQTSGIEGPDGMEKVTERLRHVYGLDEPLPSQYLTWLSSACRLDFGLSLSDRRPVVDRILERLPATVSLSFFSLLVALATAVPIGIIAAQGRGRAFDRMASLILYALYAVPSFAMALGLLYLFGFRLGWLPLHGIRSDDFAELSLAGKLWDVTRHHLLPVICLAYGSLAYYARFVRLNVIEALGADYVRSARARGVSESRVVWCHVLRNTLVPLITLVALLLPALVSGSVILETVFAWPGIGRLLYESVIGRDYPTIMGLSFLSAVIVLLATLLADLVYGLADPRVRYE